MSRILGPIAAQASWSCLRGRRAPPSFLRTMATAGPSKDAIVVGCVSYCDAVGSIWQGMVVRFRSRNVPLDFVLFTSYERQVEALLKGHVDIAWNGPLAHVRTQRRTKNASISLGMRDCDRDFASVVVARAGSGVTSLEGVVGKRIAAGTYDSPQAYILPMHHLSKAVPLGALDVVRFDRDVGKHGDTAVGEEEVIRALSEGRADVGLLSKMMLDRAFTAGTLKGGDVAVVSRVPAFDHCQFDSLPALAAGKREAFLGALFAMDWGDEADRPVMQAEGITRRWEQAREEGYAMMREATAEEPNEAFPPCMHAASRHPFKSLTLL